MVASLAKPKKYSKAEREALGRFTIQEYYEYTKRETWRDDFRDMDGKNDEEITKEYYEDYWVACVDDWLRQSQTHWRAVKREWAHAVKRFEYVMDRMREMSESSKADPSQTNLPFLYQGLIELVALLFDSLPRPSYQSRQAQVDDFAGSLNYFAAWEMDANSFDMLMYDVGLDVQLFNLGVLKFTVDMSETGPFSREGRIDIRRTEPRYIHPDPYAQKMEWKYMNWLIEASPYDLGDIRRMYPDNGHRVNAEASYSTTRADEGESQDTEDTHVISSPANFNKTGPFTVGERKRAVLKECWLRDETLEFKAEEEWFDNVLKDDNGDLILDELGQEQFKTDLPKRGWMQPKVDEDTGFVMGAWVRKYPHGRYIVTCNGVLLVDIPNPYEHKGPPYVFFRGRPSKQCLSPGDATFLIVVERKLNDLYNRIFKMAQANIERPKILDQGAFDAPKKWRNIEAASDMILQVRPGAMFKTVDPGEIPVFVAPFAQFLKNFFDDLLGVNAVMQGKMTEGAQLSSDALGALQDQAGTRTRMKARFIESGLKDVGFILMWLIRSTYKSNQEVQLVDPSTKEPVTVKWSPDDAGDDDYVVVIQAGSSLPGAKQGAYQQAMSMYRERIVDAEYVLATAQIPGAERILQRQRKNVLEDITAQAMGRTLGLQVKAQMKTDESPGRKKA